jgi:hypothetical protein
VDEKIVKVKNGQYEAYSVNSVDTCVTPGEYNFTVYDEYGKPFEVFSANLQVPSHSADSKQAMDCAAHVSAIVTKFQALTCHLFLQTVPDLL